MTAFAKSALAAAALLLAAVPQTLGHGDLQEPPARNVGGSGRNGYCPHCGNGGGVCGDGGQWPPGSNYLGHSDGPQRTYQAGQVVELEVRITAHHKGHFEFHVCDEHLGELTPDPEGPDGCLNKWVLERVPPEESYSDCVPNDPRGDCQPLDEDHPERWYLPPISGSHLAGWSHKMRFRIPQGLHCQYCTLQWRWWTANSCIPAPGYGCYFQRIGAMGWNWVGGGGGGCSSSLLQSNASSTAQGLSHRSCGEEFRNCADITILGDGAEPGSTTQSPTRRRRTTTPTPTGTCVRNDDCAQNAWCNQDNYVAWCPAQGAARCPWPQCVVEGDDTTTTAAPTLAATTTAAPQTTVAPTPVATTARTTAAPVTTATTTTTMPPTPAPAGSIRSGDRVMLRVARSGHRITVQADGQVHAQWDHQGEWQELVVEKMAGAGDCPSPEVVCHGDTVLFVAWTGRALTVQGSRVHAEWDHRGSWQKFVVESESGPGAVLPDSVVFLRAHTGAQVDADAPDSLGVVQARWAHQGDWQKLVIERVTPLPAPAPAPAPTADPRCEGCIGHSACIWSDDMCYPAVIQDACEQLGKVYCGDTIGAQQPAPQPAPAPTPGMDPRCSECKGPSPCIWSDGQCYVAVAESACKATSDAVWCGGASLAQVGPQAGQAMRKKVHAHKFLALLQAGASVDRTRPGVEL